MKLNIYDLKGQRETLCLAQTEIARSPYISDTVDSRNPSALSDKSRHIRRLQNLIDEIDILRPLGPDGKHGNLHTRWCGCDRDD